MLENNEKRLLNKLGPLYGIIISFINYIGYLIPAKGNMPVRETPEYIIWTNYIARNKSIITVISIFSFIIPILLCVAYIVFANQKNIRRRIINIPIVFSSFGAVGWFFTLFFETIFLVYCKFKIQFSIYQIFITSCLNILQVCLFIFTLAFFTLDYIHRIFILPKYYPEGNLTKVQGALKLSVKGMFLILYISVSIFPIFYLFSMMYNICLNAEVNIPKSVYIVLAFILGFGFAIISLITNYFSRPLKKLNRATQKIKEGKYNQKVQVTSCDDFGKLADSFNEMANSLDEKTKKIYAIQDSVIRGMAVMIESRDNSTGGHINRTSDCVKIFTDKIEWFSINSNNKEYAQFKKLSHSFYASMIKAAPMHDLGKIAVDDAVLRKPGKFTDAEYEIMKKHSAEGARIVESVLHEVDDEEFKSIAVNVAHYHHEKWNGTGYPEKIAGEEIPVEARIMALADVFDALVSKRCYKESFSFDKAFSIIEDSLGTHFDPVLGKIFLSCKKELCDLYKNYNS